MVAEAAREDRSAAFAAAARRGVITGESRGVITLVAELGRELNLVLEIGCCRLMMQRLMAIDGLDGDARKLAKSLRALNRALTGAMRLQWVIQSEGGSSASEALTALLADLGGV